MVTKRQMRELLATAGVAIVVSFPVAASAQTTDYPGSPPPEVQGESISRDLPQVPGEKAQVLGENLSRGGGSLPVTGGDIAGLAVLGLGAVVTGSVLVRRSRPRPT